MRGVEATHLPVVGAAILPHELQVSVEVSEAGVTAALDLRRRVAGVGGTRQRERFNETQMARRAKTKQFKVPSQIMTMSPQEEKNNATLQEQGAGAKVR